MQKTTEADSYYNNLETMSVQELLMNMNKEDKSVPLAVEKAIPQIEKLVEVIVSKMQQGGRLFYMGAGTSGRLGILDASECPPTYGIAQGIVVGLIAGGAEAFIKAQEGVEDKEELGVADLQSIQLTAKDIVCGIAASGRTPYVIGGLDYARSLGCVTIAVACNKNSVIGQHADLQIEVAPGAEVVTGSTRMKAGTTQKLILNMLSTTTMINLGKVYKNLMVDVKTSNAKLEARAKKIIMDATEVDYATAEKYLQLANNHVKTAIVMLLNNSTLEEAQTKLTNANGVIRNII